MMLVSVEMEQTGWCQGVACLIVAMGVVVGGCTVGPDPVAIAGPETPATSVTTTTAVASPQDTATTAIAAPTEAQQTSSVVTSPDTQVMQPIDTATAGSGPEAPAETELGIPAPAAEDSFCGAFATTQGNCWACHGEAPAAGAPMKLLTHADFVAPAFSDPARKVYELIAERIHTSGRPMPPRPQVLTDPDKTMFDDWIAAGAPPPPAAGCTNLPPVPEAPVEQEFPAACEGNTYTLLTYGEGGASTPHVVPAGTETQRSFTFDAPWGDAPVQMVAYRPIIGEGNVAHHWILYSTGGVGGGDDVGIGGRFLITWSPGKDEDHGLPDNVGIFLPSGPDSLSLNMHYYNVAGEQDVPDRTGLEICVSEDFREHSATVSTVSASATVAAGANVDNARSCTVSTTSPDLHLLSVSPHMHGLGVNATLELTRAGMTTVLHDGPFSFEDQTIYTLGDLPLMNGDVLTTTCSFENTTSQMVTFGSSTTDEMCINFLLYYPMGAFSCR